MKTKNITILAIDDSEIDQELITRAFRKNGVSGPIYWVSCGDDAIAYLKGVGQYADRSRFGYPNFIMTDLKMPNGDGFSVLKHLKSRPEWAVIPTVVFSASSDLDDVKRSYMLGASSYIIKPVVFDEMRDCIKILYDYWMLCETPEVDMTGKRLDTVSCGKLGARFIHQNDNEEV